MRVIFHINDILNDSLQKILMQVYENSYKHVYLHADLLPLQCSNVCLARQQASLYSDRFYFQNVNVHADAFSSPKQTILHRYRNEINTVNQVQLNQSTNVHLLIPRFMKGLCSVYNYLVLLGELFSLDVFIVISPGTTLIIKIS